MFDELSSKELEECNGGFGVWGAVTLILSVGAALGCISYQVGYNDGKIAAYKDGYVPTPCPAPTQP